MTEPTPQRVWSEQNSRDFIDFGRYFVPDRELQIRTICDLIPTEPKALRILELCCGEGLLAGALLDRFPSCTVHGYDGSPEMLHQAQASLARHGERFQPQLFDLAARTWRQLPWTAHAVVSSLAIHHLDDAQKQTLFHDIYHILEPGGVLIIADLIAPANAQAVAVAATAWDEAVQQRAIEIDGETDAFDFFQESQWNLYRYPDPTIDKPSSLFRQLKWLEAAGFTAIDVYWLKAGHAIFGAVKANHHPNEHLTEWV